jgi:hypothetical protein
MSLTHKIKYCLLQQYGFKKGYLVCTEFSYSLGISDVFCINKKFEKQDIIDIEIKISKADFLNDFKNKKLKHDQFRLIQTKQLKYPHVPTKFYFCVPHELVEFCLNFLTENNFDNYGLIEYYEVYTTKNILDLDRCLRVIKKAKRLTTFELEDFQFLKDCMLNRLRNDCIGFYKTLAWNTGRYATIKKEVVNEV